MTNRLLMEFVINEWLPEYFRPTASKTDKAKLFKFLTFLLNNNTVRIVVRRPSPFLAKLYRMPKDFPNDSLALRPLKAFIGGILENSAKCRFIDSEELTPMPNVLMNLLNEGNYASDTYLFEAAFCLPENRIIVTTDAKLVKHMKDKVDCQLVLLDDFLGTFIT